MHGGHGYRVKNDIGDDFGFSKPYDPIIANIGFKRWTFNIIKKWNKQ